MAIHACEFGAEPERALAYVRTMGSASGLKPRAQQYEAAIKAMVAARRYRDAYQLLAEAVEVSEMGGAGERGLRDCAQRGRIFDFQARLGGRPRSFFERLSVEGGGRSLFETSFCLRWYLFRFFPPVVVLSSQ